MFQRSERIPVSEERDMQRGREPECDQFSAGSQWKEISDLSGALSPAAGLSATAPSENDFLSLG